MAKAWSCDNCKKLISESDIRIVLNGYSVLQSEDIPVMPKGYSIGKPEEFCSFTCLSRWANNEQKMLDDYIEASRQVEDELCQK